jgi:DNA-binding CsgD family transcriptional regulator
MQTRNACSENGGSAYRVCVTQGFVPTASVDEAARQLGASTLGAVLLRAVAFEPGTGVSITSLKLRVCFANAHLARIYIGNDAEPAKFIGRYAHDWMPVAWVRERILYYKRADETDTPFLLRVIWNDHQHFTWHYPLHAVDDHNDQIFLTITRRVSSDAEAADLAPDSNFDMLDARCMRLASLDALSPRELEVLSLLGMGLSTSEVGTRLELAEKTVNNMRGSIYAKLKVSDRAEVIAIARRAGLSIDDAKKIRV